VPARRTARGGPALSPGGGAEPPTSAASSRSPSLTVPVAGGEETGGGSGMEGVRMRRRGRAGEPEGVIVAEMLAAGSQWLYPLSMTVGSGMKELCRRALPHAGCSGTVRELRPGLGWVRNSRDDYCMLGRGYLIAGQSESDFLR
jgi:hypothetical protein